MIFVDCSAALPKVAYSTISRCTRAASLRSELMQRFRQPSPFVPFSPAITALYSKARFGGPFSLHPTRDAVGVQWRFMYGVLA
jgi:hypothetical protein